MYNQQTTIMSSQYLSKNVQTSKIEFFDELKVLPNGMSILNYAYDGGKTLSIQTPKMFAPFGVSDYNGDGKFSISLSLVGADSNRTLKEMKKIDEFGTCIKSVEDTLIDIVFKNQKKWFGFKKEKSREVIVSEHLSSLIKIGKQKDDGTCYNDTVKISVKQPVQSYLKSGEEMTFEELTEEIMFDSICVIKITGAWISKSLKKFGFFTKLQYVQVTPKERQSLELVVDSEDSDSEEVEDLDDDELE